MLHEQSFGGKRARIPPVHIVAPRNWVGVSALTDFESKYVEAGLGWCEISEAKEFHAWSFMNSFVRSRQTHILYFSNGRR